MYLHSFKDFVKKSKMYLHSFTAESTELRATETTTLNAAPSVYMILGYNKKKNKRTKQKKKSITNNIRIDITKTYITMN